MNIERVAQYPRGATTRPSGRSASSSATSSRSGPASECFGGCGWGSFAIHCAATRGTEVVGITLSEPQARFAQHRAARAGVADRVEIRVMDYRQLTGARFDAVASIGMVERVGRVEIDRYAQRLGGLLELGGRLLNHVIARLRHGDPDAGPVLRALCVPGRGAAAPVAGPFGARACRLRDRARLRLYRRLSRDPDPLADASRGSPRGARPARRRAARPRLGDLPPRGAQRGSRRVSRRSTKSARIWPEGLAALVPGRGGANRRAPRCSRTAVCGRAPAGPRPDPPTREP